MKTVPAVLVSIATAAGIWIGALPALAAGLEATAPAPGAAPAPEDYRGRVMTAVGFLFALIVGFLVISQRRAARQREELEHLARRVADLEARRAS